MFLLLIILVSLASGYELSSVPESLHSINGTGYSPWQNARDASCNTTRAAASECYARGDTETLEASGFFFDVPNVTWLEARWEVSVFPVPLEGWILETLEMRWNDSFVIDRASPNYTSHDEGVEIRVRAAGDLNWSRISLRIAFSSTNEDALFLVSCVELRAGSDWTPPIPQPPELVHYEYFLAGAIALCGVAIAIHRVRARRRVVRHGSEDVELGEIEHTLYVERAALSHEKTGFRDAFVASAERCVANGRPSIACKLTDPGDCDRFRRLRGAHHVNLVHFMGLYRFDSHSVFTIWRSYRARLNDWRQSQDACASLALRISQAAACGLAVLQDHMFVHGDVSCRNMVIDGEGCIKLSDAGHARRHDVEKYLDREPGDSPLRGMAPEAAKGGVLDLATDRWSFGALCWEAGSRVDAIPFVRLTNREWLERSDELDWERPEHASDAMWSVATHCLLANRDERQGVGALRNELLAESRDVGQCLEEEEGDDEALYLVSLERRANRK